MCLVRRLLAQRSLSITRLGGAIYCLLPRDSTKKCIKSSDCDRQNPHRVMFLEKLLFSLLHFVSGSCSSFVGLYTNTRREDFIHGGQNSVREVLRENRVTIRYKGEMSGPKRKSTGRAVLSRLI